MPISEKEKRKITNFTVMSLLQETYNTWRINNSITSFPSEKTFMREIIIIYIDT